MPATTWIAAAIVAALAVAAVAAALLWARRRHRTYVPAVPATISVSGPVEDVLESPRHAAEARAAAAPIGGTVVGEHRSGA